jgi:hypothetical protein
MAASGDPQRFSREFSPLHALGAPRGCICGGERPGRGAEQFDPDQRPSVKFRKHSHMDLRPSIEKAALATIIVSSLVIVSVLFAILAPP